MDDSGQVAGIASDYDSLRKEGKDDRDRFKLHLANICAASFGAAAAANISAQILNVEGHDLARVHVKPAGFPVDAEVTVDRKGQLEKKTAFYIRLNNGTVELDEAERQKFVSTRWPPGR